METIVTLKKLILILAANPKNTDRVRLDEEMREIQNGLQRAKQRDEFEIKTLLAPRPIDVRRALLDLKPTVVHFCGHGSGEDGLVFEDEAGLARFVDSRTLTNFFSLFADVVECVLLNACYSDVQATAISERIKYVVGMNKAIGDRAAINFAVAFYDALGAGKTYEFAFDCAKNAIEWDGSPDNLTPVLKQRTDDASSETITGSTLPEITVQNDGSYILPHGFKLKGKNAVYVIRKLPSERVLSVSYIADEESSTPESRERFFIKSIHINSAWSHDEITSKIYKLSQHIQNELDKAERLRNVKNIGRAVDSGEYELVHNGIRYKIPFLVQSYVEGRNLEKYVSEKLTKPGKAFHGIESRESWFDLTKKLLSVLGEIHKSGVAHGDIQPKNIIVEKGKNKDIEVYFVDFGHAFFLNLFFAEKTLLSDYSAIAYVAPEKRNSESYGTTASDIYSLGGILYMLATGEDPPTPKLGKTSLESKFALKEYVITSLVKRNPTLHNECPGVADIIIQCLHYTPEDRARHTDDVLNVLNAFSYAADPHATVDSESLMELAKEVNSEVLDFCRFVGGDSVQRNELFGRIFQLKLQEVLRSLKDMIGGDLVEIRGNRDEIISGFLTYLSILKRRDRYVTTTIPRFWLPSNLGINGRFLRMNELLATKHQVSIRRVFLISSEDQQMEYFHEIIQAQRDLIFRLRDRGVETQSKALNETGYYTGYVEVNPLEQHQLFVSQGHHVGLVQNFNECQNEFDHSVSVIFDTEGLDQAIRRIVLWKITTQRTKRILDEMKLLLERSKTITDFKF